MVKSSYKIYTVSSPSAVKVTPDKFAEVNMGNKTEKVYFLQPGQTISDSVGEATNYRFEYDTNSSGSNPVVEATKISAVEDVASPFATSVPASSSGSAVPITPTPSPSSAPLPKSSSARVATTDEQIKAFVNTICDKIYSIPESQTIKGDLDSRVEWSSYPCHSEAKFTDFVVNGTDVHNVDYLNVDEFENLYWIYVLSQLYKKYTSSQKDTLFRERIDTNILQKFALIKTAGDDLTFEYTYPTTTWRGATTIKQKLTVDASQAKRILDVESADAVEDLLKLQTAGGRRRLPPGAANCVPLARRRPSLRKRRRSTNSRRAQRRGGPANGVATLRRRPSPFS